jgi:hypothetical protein
MTISEATRDPRVIAGSHVVRFTDDGDLIQIRVSLGRVSSRAWLDSPTWGPWTAWGGWRDLEAREVGLPCEIVPAKDAP